MLERLRVLRILLLVVLVDLLVFAVVLLLLRRPSAARARTASRSKVSLKPASPARWGEFADLN